MKYQLILALLLLSACQQKGDLKNTAAPANPEKESQEEMRGTLENPEGQNQSDSTRLPDHSGQFNEIQTDTIEFIDYNDDFDYHYLTGRKKGKTLSFVYSWDWTESQEYHFRPGDLILIEWKMDSLHMAGDEEVVNVVERAIDAKKIDSGNLPISFLIREERYDESVRAKVSTMVINQSYLHQLSPPERAALGYIAFDIGNECEWGFDSQGTKALQCQLVTALDLGHQCSDTQLDFLRKWFSKDSVALDKLKSCPLIPNSATVQSTFDEILIQKDTSNNTLTVRSKITAINLRESKSWTWLQTDRFAYSQDYIRVVDSQKSELREHEIDLNPDHASNNELQ